MRRGDQRRSLRLLVGVLSCIAVSSVRAQTQPQAAVGAELGPLELPAGAATAEPLVLPVQGQGAVHDRYVARLQRAIGTVGGQAKPSSPPPHFVLPAAEGLGPCGGNPLCLLKVGQKLHAKRVVGTTLSFEGSVFQVAMTVIDVASERLLEVNVAAVQHNALKKAGRALFSETLMEARQPLPPPHPQVKRLSEMTSDELSALVVEAAGQPTPMIRPGHFAPRTRGEERKPAPMVGLSAEELQQRIDEAAGEDFAEGSEADPATASGLIAEPAVELSHHQEKKDTARMLLGAQRSHGPRVQRRAPFEWPQIRSRQWAKLAVGVLAFNLGLALELLRRRGRGRRYRSSELTVDPKEEAETHAALRECAKKRTPGLLMSPDLEAAKRFTFMLLDGNQLSVDVMEVTLRDRTVFRAGNQVCAQFVHKGGPALCMVTVIRSKQISPRRLRVVLTVPARLSPIKVGRVPVDRRAGLWICVARESEAGVEHWYPNPTYASPGTLEIAVDDHAFALQDGDALLLSMRLKNERVEASARVAHADDERLELTVGDLVGGSAPREYRKLVQRLESEWFANLGR